MLGVLNTLSRHWAAAVTEYKPKMQYMLIVSEPFPPAQIGMDTHAHTQLINQTLSQIPEGKACENRLALPCALQVNNICLC